MFDRISSAPWGECSITRMLAAMAVKANGAFPQVSNTRSILTAPNAKDPGARLQATRAFISVPRFESQSFKVRGDFYADQPVLRRVVVSDRQHRRTPGERGRLVTGHIVSCACCRQHLDSG